MKSGPRTKSGGTIGELVPPALISSAPIGERSSRGSVTKFRASLPVWTPLPEAVRSGTNLEYDISSFYIFIYKNIEKCFKSIETKLNNLELCINEFPNQICK